MNTSFNERISAFTDDELSTFETRRIVDELLSNPDLKARVARYQLIGDAMRDELPARLDPDFATRVMERIALEPSLENDAPVGTQHAWLKPVSGMAIAASVAVASILALKLFTQDDVAPVGEVAVVEPAPLAAPDVVAPIVTPVASSGGTLVQPVSVGKTIPVEQAGSNTLFDPRMNSYLATHAEFAARPGIMSRVRMVGFDSTEE